MKRFVLGNTFLFEVGNENIRVEWNNSMLRNMDLGEPKSCFTKELINSSWVEVDQSQLRNRT